MFSSATGSNPVQDLMSLQQLEDAKVEVIQYSTYPPEDVVITTDFDKTRIFSNGI